MEQIPEDPADMNDEEALAAIEELPAAAKKMAQLFIKMDCPPQTALLSTIELKQGRGMTEEDARAELSHCSAEIQSTASEYAENPIQALQEAKSIRAISELPLKIKYRARAFLMAGYSPSLALKQAITRDDISEIMQHFGRSQPTS